MDRKTKPGRCVFYFGITFLLRRVYVCVAQGLMGDGGVSPWVFGRVCLCDGIGLCDRVLDHFYVVQYGTPVVRVRRLPHTHFEQQAEQRHSHTSATTDTTPTLLHL